MFVLGLITARGGSKRIPRKNVKILGKVPLVAWTISAGSQSQSLDGLVVSTEDQEIVEISRSWGAEVLRRPNELATDTASSYDVMKHALDSTIRPVDFLCLLQPTSPFRTNVDIDQCVSLATRHYMPVVAAQWGRNVPNGSIYVAPTSWIRDGGNFDGPGPLYYWMPPERSMDLDTPEDWERAEQMISAWSE